MAISGGIFFIAAALALLRLDQGTVEGRLVIAMLMGAVAMLAIAFLRREGCDAYTLLLALLPLGLAFYLRAACLDYITSDYTVFLSQWVEFFREQGGLAALRQPIGNYNVPYLYFLALISWLPLPDLYLIKLFSISFDVLLAWGCMRIVRVFHPQSRLPEAAFLITLLLPTVLMNGALWGQCDSVYTALCVLSLASILEDHPRRATALAALAFSFKLQAIFFIPVLLAFALTRRVTFRQLLLYPAAYAASIFPALLLGKPLGDILGVYWGQVNSYTNHLTLNAPSWFAFFPAGSGSGLASFLGIAIAGFLTFCILGLLFLLRPRVTDRVLLTAAALLCLVIPYLLPHMHERYFMLAELLTILFCCVMLRGMFIPALVQVAALGGYYAFLMGRYAFPMSLGSVMMLLAILFLTFDLWIQLDRPTRIIPRLLRRLIFTRRKKPRAV